MKNNNGVIDVLVLVSIVITITLLGWGKYVVYFFQFSIAFIILFIVMPTLISLFIIFCKSKYTHDVCFNGDFYAIKERLPLLPGSPHNIFGFNIVYFDDKDNIIKVERYDKPDKIRFVLVKYDNEHRIIKKVDNVPMRLIQHVKN